MAASCGKGARIIVAGRLDQRSYEPKEGGDTRNVVEIVADEAGPSLRWAQAQIEKTEREKPDRAPHPADTDDGTDHAGTAPARAPDPVYGNEDPF